ncbi:S-adenosylmethionine:tRNA ribosyltransferase-isomerase, partial [Candidatus Uhrbacteria bacterium]|nr:S-adenosylmethionine:tRNA ribosyltransferase-isomerase [Candidatus Uhrbacteria bacterium]
HVMHAEWASLSQQTIDAIHSAQENNGRIIAVGTTSARVLEGVFAQHGKLVPFDDDLNLFVRPGFSFRVVDALITNFHLPKTTLLALVAAFLGSRDRLFDCYTHALSHDYRFASFGDAMLII